MFGEFIAPMVVFLPALACGVLLCLTTAATSVAVRHHRITSQNDAGDQVFWDLFAGAAVAVPAVLVPSLISPAAGLAVAAAGATAGIAAYRRYPQLNELWQARQRRRAATSGLGAARERHQRSLAVWRRYELDPALTIEFPAMTDVGRPETAQLIRAIRNAEAIDPMDEPENYSRAVDKLEEALKQAEAAAGSSQHNGQA